MSKKGPKRRSDFIEIGGSPVPGLKLRQILRGHSRGLNRIAWSPDGECIASPHGRAICIWDMHTGELINSLVGHDGDVICISWSLDNKYIVSASSDIVCLWEASSGNRLYTLNGHKGLVFSVAWSPDGKLLATASVDSIRLWMAASGEHLQTLRGDTGPFFSIAWSPDGLYLASTSLDEKVYLWNTSSCELVQTLEVSSHTDLNKYYRMAYNLGFKSALADETFRFLSTSDGPDLAAFAGNNTAAWSPDGKRLISASGKGLIYIWNPSNGKVEHVLEGHKGPVNCAFFSNDGTWLASKSNVDRTIRLWRCDTWSCVVVLFENATDRFSNIAFHPHLPLLATNGLKLGNQIIRIWELDETILLGLVKENVNYTTAKLVLVGDSGVGKTGLGWRLAHGEFKEHASTHGQQFWSIPQLGLKRKDGTDCEAVLWDLAGQHIYRQLHSIFLENIAAALVLFDPTNRQEPLKGAQFWLEQLKGNKMLPPTVLVGARVDRGAPALSQTDLDQFCQRYGINGGYISTSAMKGDGLDALLNILKKQIPWDDMTATVTTITFKRIKDYVLSLKEKTDRKGVLVSPKELRAQLEAMNDSITSEPWKFTNEEMMTAIGHLETHGYITILHNSAGEQYILLAPDLLVNLAASIVLLADKNVRELGAVNEEELLQGKVSFEELKGLEKTEQRILTDAAILRFLAHNICFRETMGNDTLLIFPSLIKQKRPLQDDLPAIDDISYIVRGRAENLYASLVVLLGYTPSFTRINQWQNQAQYEMEAGQVCGFRLIEEREGEIELVLYYVDSMPQGGRDKFQELFEQFLYQRDVDVTRFPPVTCKNSHRIERATVVKRLREGKGFVFCDECGKKTILPDFDKPQTIGTGASPWLQREESMARLRSSYEKNLTNIKSFRRGWEAPRAYLSHLPEQKTWANKLIHDLQDAGVYIVEKTDDLDDNDFVIVLDTAAYKKAFDNSTHTPEIKVVKSRLGGRKLISIGCEGRTCEHHLQKCPTGSFGDETHYCVSLFNLIMELYAIPLNHKAFEPLRRSLHVQWERTLAGDEEEEMVSPLKIFISYSHKDEEFKDELVTMLAGLQRRKIIEAWHDRHIEAGDEWHKSIQNAMDNCNLAILLVSPNYLASRFIQIEEQPKLLKRREEMKSRVMPIIIRPCTWKSEEPISILQVMPEDGRPVIKFSKDNGDRDEVWAEIAAVIEKRAKEKSI